MSDFYLWTETVNFNLGQYPGDFNPKPKTVTVVKYKTTGVLDLGGVTFVITPGSGTFPEVANNCNNQTFQGSQFLHMGQEMPTGVPVTADIYNAGGNLWGLCSGNEATNIITLAGDTGLQSSTNGTNVLAYLYDDHFTISSISSVSNSSGQSYGSNGWSFQMGDPTAVSDSTAPVINLNGPSSSNHEVGPPYTDAGATATDETDTNVTSSMTTTITKDGAAFNDDISTIGYVTGTYVITYNVSDAAGNAATPVTSTVTVADTLDPTMELQGDAEVTITVGQSYSDAGVIPGDNYDQSPTISITITKNDAAFNDDITTIGNAVGTYVITYTASDAAGNTAQVTRTVTVEAAPVTDITAPVINLNGASTITLTVGQTYTELVSATDTVDGTVTVTIGGDTVNTGVAGTYTLTYNATDAAQNAAAQVTRTVTVEAATDTTWGDITNDGSIGAADVVYLASYLAGESGFIHGGPSAPAS